MRTLSLFCLFLLPGLLGAQRIANFNASPAGESVLIRFVIKAGAPCNGYDIYHSTDSINYYVIEPFAGICGDGSDYSVTYTHTSPSRDHVNYYKVSLGTFETSPVARVYMSTSLYYKMTLWPNPIGSMNDALSIRIQNTRNLRLVGDIYDQSGNSKRALDIKMTGDLTTVPIGDLDNGLYFVWLTDGNQLFQSKLVIRR